MLKVFEVYFFTASVSNPFVDDAFLFTLLFHVLVIEVFFLDYIVLVDLLGI